MTSVLDVAIWAAYRLLASAGEDGRRRPLAAALDVALATGVGSATAQSKMPTANQGATMTRQSRWFLAAAVAVVLSCVAPAQAAGPEKEIFPFEGSIENWVECPEQGFNIRIEFFGIDVDKTWRDSEGNVTRIKIHSSGTGTLVNQSDPTKTETGSSPTNITVDFQAETFTVSGMPLHNNIPGEGRVAHETGTITYPIEVIDRQTGEFEVDFDVVLRSGGKHPEFVDWCSMVD